MQKRNLLFPLLLGLLLTTSCTAKSEKSSLPKEEDKVESISKAEQNSAIILGKRADLKEKEKSKTPEKSKDMAKTINEFSGKSFYELFKYEREVNPDKSVVYSPYSYLSALSMLNKYTDFSKDNELKDYEGLDFKNYKVNNLESKNVLLARDTFVGKNAKSDDEYKVVKFPKEAEAESKKLQQEVLKEVLSAPNYDDPAIQMVIINATRFLGYWSTYFDKDMTNKADYTMANGNKIKVDMMHSSDLAKDNNMAYEDGKLQMYRKPLTEKEGSKEITGYAYIVKPKDTLVQEKELASIVKGLDKLVSSYGDKAKKYDSVYLDMPKIDITSRFDLKKIEEINGKKFIKDSYKIKKEFAGSDTVGTNIGGIGQVAKLQVDEKKVEAKAVTDIVMLTSLAPEKKSVFELVANSPFFMVTTSLDKDGKEVISFASFIDSPVQK